MKVDISYPEDKDPVYNIELDPQDTWSMDYTLAHIILPMLIQLKKTKHGAPFTDDGDCPEELHEPDDFDNATGDVDENWFKRWDYIMDEMIWTFEQIIKDNRSYWVDDDNKDLIDRYDNGLRLFGKYYNNLWD